MNYVINHVYYLMMNYSVIYSFIYVMIFIYLHLHFNHITILLKQITVKTLSISSSMSQHVNFKT
jgi:hypothetical protein